MAEDGSGIPTEVMAQIAAQANSETPPVVQEGDSEKPDEVEDSIKADIDESETEADNTEEVRIEGPAQADTNLPPVVKDTATIEAHEAEVRRIRHDEVDQTAETVVNTRMNAIGAEVATIADPAERIKHIDQLPSEQRALLARYKVFHATESLPLSGPEDKNARYSVVINGIDVNLGAIVSVKDKHTLVCSVFGSKTGATVEVPRNVLLQSMLETDQDEILANFPDTEQILIKKHIELKTIKEPDDSYYEGLPSYITEIARNNGIISKDVLIHAYQNKYKTKLAKVGATQEEQDQNAAENLENTAKLLQATEELNERFGDRILATPDDIKFAMKELEMTPEAMDKKIIELQDRITAMEEAAKNATGERKRQLNEWLDNARATVKVYSEVLPTISDDTVDNYVANQRDGGVPADLNLQIYQAIERNEMDALLLMASPEASVGASAEAIAKARMQREKLDKYLKGIGIAGGIIGLMIALGLVSGAKG